MIFPNSGIDSEDWNGNSSGGIVSRVQQAAQQGRLDGQVVLMHENYDSTATAVEQLCPWLEQNGYAVVTVSEMFKFHNKELKGGKIYTIHLGAALSYKEGTFGDLPRVKLQVLDLQLRRPCHPSLYPF